MSEETKLDFNSLKLQIAEGQGTKIKWTFVKDGFSVMFFETDLELSARILEALEQFQVVISLRAAVSRIGAEKP